MDTLRDKNYLEDLWNSKKPHGNCGMINNFYTFKKILEK
jgi:hypothetical protein